MSPQGCLWTSSESGPTSLSFPSSWATFLTYANSAKIEVEVIILNPVREAVSPGTLGCKPSTVSRILIGRLACMSVEVREEDTKLPTPFIAGDTEAQRVDLSKVTG